MSLKRVNSKSSTDSETDTEQEWVKRFSEPRELPPLEPIPTMRIWKIKDGIKESSQPKAAPGYLPPRSLPLPIKEKTLKYEMTDTMKRLASAIPERYRRKFPTPSSSSGTPPSTVKKSALTYKITEHIKKLAQPKHSRMKFRRSDVEEQPFPVSKNALQYKVTPRIQELAQPKKK